MGSSQFIAAFLLFSASAAYADWGEAPDWAKKEASVLARSSGLNVERGICSYHLNLDGVKRWIESTEDENMATFAHQQLYFFPTGDLRTAVFVTSFDDRTNSRVIERWQTHPAALVDSLRKVQPGSYALVGGISIGELLFRWRGDDFMIAPMSNVSARKLSVNSYEFIDASIALRRLRQAVEAGFRLAERLRDRPEESIRRAATLVELRVYEAMLMAAMGGSIEDVQIEPPAELKGTTVTGEHIYTTEEGMPEAYLKAFYESVNKSNNRITLDALSVPGITVTDKIDFDETSCFTMLSPVGFDSTMSTAVAFMSWYCRGESYRLIVCSRLHEGRWEPTDFARLSDRGW